jgi:hypothetical protein
LLAALPLCKGQESLVYWELLGTSNRKRHPTVGASTLISAPTLLASTTLLVGGVLFGRSLAIIHVLESELLPVIAFYDKLVNAHLADGVPAFDENFRYVDFPVVETETLAALHNYFCGTIIQQAEMNYLFLPPTII